MPPRKLKIAHPGEILREEFLEPMGLSAYALAKSLRIPLPRVNDVVRERRGISAEMALLLGAFFDTSETFWVNLQAHYELARAKPKLAKKLAAVRRERSISRRSAT